MKYTEKLLQSISRSSSLLCVGLDPVPESLPVEFQPADAQRDGNGVAHHRSDAQRVKEFCLGVIEATCTHAAAFKVNTAFFEALGRDGWEVLHDVCQAVPEDIPLIVDAKRGDIGNTSAMYAKAIFGELRCDAVTLNPLMGLETFAPFLNDASKCVYGLVLTSNPGASEFLGLSVSDSSGSQSTLAEKIAAHLAVLQKAPQTHASLGMVVGATRPGDVSGVLSAFPTAPLLIPGIGAQGGNPANWTPLLQKHLGIPLFNASRSILYPSTSGDHWMDAIANAAESARRSLPDHSIVINR